MEHRNGRGNVRGSLERVTIIALGAAPLVALGCNGVGSTSGRHVLPTHLQQGGSTSPGTTAASGSGSGSGATTATGAMSAAAAAAFARNEELRAIAATYVASGDLQAALAALATKKATPPELLAALRERGKIVTPGAGGNYVTKITDGYGTTTDLHVAAPPETEIAKRAATGMRLVILLHGINGNGGQPMGYGKELAATNECIAVAPSVQPLPGGYPIEDGIPAQLSQQFPSWWMYEPAKSFTLEALRKARSMYPLDPEKVVLAGASMGGYGTWNIGLRHADRWAAIAPMCGGLSRLGHVGMEDSRSNALLVNGLLFPVWAAHGDADTVVPYAPDKKAADSLTALGGDVTFKTLVGVGHDMAGSVQGTGPLAAELRAFVTTKVRKASPTKVTYLSAGTTLDGAHWLRIATRSPGDRAKITGEVDTAKNSVNVTGESVEKARIYLDDRILDLSKPVVVQVKGQTRSSAVVAPNMTAVLESWKSRQDEGLVYMAFVEVDPR